MITAFLETSAINWLFNNGFDSQKTSQLFSSNKLIPVVGMDTIYELGRYFTTTTPENASSLFNFLKLLKPIYSCQRAMLYNQELDNLLHGFSVDPLLGYYSEEILIERIEQFSLGIFDNMHEEFIAGRQFFWGDCREKVWSPDKVKQNLNLTFENYLKYCLLQIEDNLSILPKWMETLTGKKLSQDNAMLFLKKLNSFKALRTALYSQFYLNYLIIRNRAIPSEDKFTDSLQIIGASYFSCIVSNDKYLLETLAPNLNPDIQVFKINSLNIRDAIV
ncbi:TPA: hypothetical protein I8Y95_003030 [Legionella pneumophila]|uniref:hypothetical protein n=1 Tax=Legionella pneumophila TaxID=446 RepID=UPI000481907D|nr:hypothetical protein [Legionella pneumophila]HAT1740213.1 hypothetical protein [Legionella pneumophila]HAT1746169.1 hypothetical protein [Legionella pneumophila]HAT1749101.1 hypothetical protein [Legionella pneumophila]HAT1755109.1 hypothetical protein [Legionella pneumophila]HAT1758502.1 hypothetical protein [Legionella pneumophila]